MNKKIELYNNNLTKAINAIKPKNNTNTTNIQQLKTNFFITTQQNKYELRTAIKAERKKQNLTQRELAKKCYLSQGTITRAERHGYISFNCLLEIAAGLNKKITLY